MNTLVAAVILTIAGVGITLTHDLSGGSLWDVTDPNPLAWSARAVTLVLVLFGATALKILYYETHQVSSKKDATPGT